MRHVFLEQEQVVRQPDRRIAREELFDLRQRSTTWIRAPLPPWSGLSSAGHVISPARAQRADVVERDRPRTVDAERVEQRGLSALAQLEGEHLRAVQHARAHRLERSHQGQSERHRPRVAAQIRARAGLVEVQPGAAAARRSQKAARETSNGSNEMPRRVERREQRLLPLGMFVQDDEVREP